MNPLAFWYEFASPYSYLAAVRIGPLAAAAGRSLAWRPFLLGPIFAAQGWNDSPFNIYPAKGAYMWRDMERLCDLHELPWRRPSAFPRNGVKAARLALALDQDSARADFSQAVFAANFFADRDIGAAEVLAEIVTELGLPAEQLALRAESLPIRGLLRAQTAEAIRLGIFGAPSFTVGNELFWGHDRLGHALAWRRRP